MKTAERVLRERREDRKYLTAKSEDVETIHFTSLIVNIFMDDGSTITVSVDPDNPGLLKYRLSGGYTVVVTP